MSHEQLSFHLFHGVQYHTNHDQHAHAGELNGLYIGKLSRQEGHNRHQRQEQSTGPGDTPNYPVEIFSGMVTGPYSGNKAALLLQGTRQVLLFEDNPGIKECETDS